MSIDSKLDRIYDAVDFLIRFNYLETLDKLLIEACEDNDNLDELLGYLTATLPVKSKLENREKVVEWTGYQIDAVYEERRIKDSLLHGLT